MKIVNPLGTIICLQVLQDIQGRIELLHLDHGFLVTFLATKFYRKNYINEVFISLYQIRHTCLPINTSMNCNSTWT